MSLSHIDDSLSLSLPPSLSLSPCSSIPLSLKSMNMSSGEGKKEGRKEGRKGGREEGRKEKRERIKKNDKQYVLYL